MSDSPCVEQPSSRILSVRASPSAHGSLKPGQLRHGYSDIRVPQGKPDLGASPRCPVSELSAYVVFLLARVRIGRVAGYVER